MDDEHDVDDSPVYEPGSVIHQLRSVIGVFLDPVRTFQSMPGWMLYPLGLAIPTVVGLGRLALKIGVGKVFGAMLAGSVFVVGAVAAQFAIVWLLRMGVASLGKRLSYWQVFNIYGYSQLPWLLGVIVGLSVAGVPAPEDPDKPSALLAVMLLVRVVLIVYSLALLVYGLRYAVPPESAPTSKTT